MDEEKRVRQGELHALISLAAALLVALPGLSQKTREMSVGPA